MSKKILSMVMAVMVTLVFSMYSTNVLAEKPESTLGINSVQFFAINDYYLSLTMPSSGKLDCLGDVTTYYQYTAKVNLELQQYTTSGWTTIKTWSQNSGINYAYVSSSYYVASGYNYRLKGTFYALQNGSVVESTYDYSQTVYY